MSSPLFIFGTKRSGATLLRPMLNCHNAFAETRSYTGQYLRKMLWP